MNSNNIVIDQIRAEDLDEIVQMGKSTSELQVTDEGHYYYEKEELLPFLNSPDGICLAARVDGKLAGFRFANFNPYLKEAYLMDLFVKPEYRRLGIGSKLYQKTFEILRKKECEWAWLLVKNSNKTMEQFLEKQGFVKGSNFNFFFKVKPF